MLLYILTPLTASQISRSSAWAAVALSLDSLRRAEVKLLLTQRTNQIASRGYAQPRLDRVRKLTLMRRCILKKLALGFLVLSLLAFSAAAAEMTGYISDAKCAKDVAKVESDGHAGCAAACAKKGEALVFVSDGKVYKVSDQSKVQDHIGHKVTITGNVDGDTLTVESVKM